MQPPRPPCLLAYERLRRERVAEVQLGARKQLYSYDVVPHADNAARIAGSTS